MSASPFEVASYHHRRLLVRHHMDLFLIPDNPERTVIVSPNGVAHYKVRTAKRNGVKLSKIQRPAETEEESVVAEIEWRRWDTPTVVRSCLRGGLGRESRHNKGKVPAMEFLYKKHPFSRTRYFIGDDGLEYRWKNRKGRGIILENHQNVDIACVVNEPVDEGLYAGERKTRLRIQPCSVDIDLIVVSYLIMEKKRRDNAGDGARRTAYDEDPVDGAADGGGE